MSTTLRPTTYTVRPVLLIEANPLYRAAIESCIRGVGCDVSSVATPHTAWRTLHGRPFDLIVWGVPAVFEGADRCNGIAELRQRSEAPLVMVDDGLPTAEFDLEAGADQWVPKPFIADALAQAIRAALAVPHLDGDVAC